MKYLTLLTAFIILSITGLKAQQTINTTGGEASGDSSVSYSIGQAFTTTLYSESNQTTVFQGVQVPFEAIEAESCPSDINGDGIVGIGDLSSLLSGFGTTCNGCATDINGDGLTSIADLSIFLASFGTECSSTS